MKNSLILFLPLIVILACSRRTTINEKDYKMDLRYSPVWGQTSICLPDEMQKTIVNDKGTLLYDYTNANMKVSGPFNGFNISVFAGLDSVGSDSASQRLFLSLIHI